MTIKEEFYDKFCAKYIKANKYFIPEYIADAPEEIIDWVETKVSQIDCRVMQQEGDFKLLQLLMSNSTARISVGNKWIVRDDNLWFVYEQPYGKKVRKLLETDKFVKALALLSV